MKRSRLVVAAIVSLTIVSCRYEPNAIQREEGAHEDVVQLLKSFVDRDPDDYVSIYTLARFAERSGNTREVVHWLRRLEATSWDRVIENDDFPASASDRRFEAVRDRLNDRAIVVASAELAFEVDQLDLLPEGMAYDPTTDRFLISSGRQRKVVSVGRDGRSFDLVKPAQDGLRATLGMKVDDGRRHVWVASAAAPFMIEPESDAEPPSVLYQFDADTGDTLGAWPVEWTPSLLNDLVVAPDGSVFATESMSGAVVRRLKGVDDLDLFLPKDTLFSPNGIAISDDGETLFVAHYHGISRVDVRTREVSELSSDDRRDRLGGIDGLYFHEGRLVGVQNLVGKGRIWSVSFDGDRIVDAEILESGNPSFRNPTTGAIAGDAFFFMSNPSFQDWEDGRVTDAPEGERLQVKWLPLEP